MSSIKFSDIRVIRLNFFIKESYNNVFFTLVDLRGRVITKLSQGLLKDINLSFKRSKPFFYDKMLKILTLKIYNLLLFRVGFNKFLFRRFILSSFYLIFSPLFLKKKYKRIRSRLRSRFLFKRSKNFISRFLIDNYAVALKKALDNREDSSNMDEDDYEFEEEKNVKLGFEIFSRYNFLRSLYFFFLKLFSLFRRFFFINVTLVLNGFFSRRLRYLILNLSKSEFMNIFVLVDYLPIAHNGCRPKKLRRL